MASVSRNQIPQSQRAALRRYFQATTPKPTHTELKAWFESQFGNPISQSCISRALSDDFMFLDKGLPSTPRYRARDCQWPWLETSLIKWLGDEQDRGIIISNIEITLQAKRIWERSAESKGLDTPSFSAGWVAKFKRRCKIERHHRIQNDTRPPRSENVGAIQSLISEKSLSVSTTISTRNQILYPAQECSVIFPFSSDHLIHLIQLNVHNALIFNKATIRRNGLILDASNSTNLSEQFATKVCGGLTVIRPLHPGVIPDSLYPTQLQMSCAHTIWLDSFPFPRFRDNLIKKGVEFVPENLLMDLFDEIFPTIRSWTKSVTELVSVLSVPSLSSIEEGVSACFESFEEMDDYTFGHGGFISWGNPWSVEDWEVTPGFLKRWAWALEGCDDLIHASNRWRAQRNEKLIPWR